MKLKKYEEAILQSKEDLDKQMAPARAQEQRAKLQMRLAELSIEIQGRENAVNTAASRYPLDVNSIVSNLDELDLLKRLETQLKGIAEQLFGA